jgi:hypothetical protein
MSGSVLQVTAIALLSDGSTRDVTAGATWATSNTAVAVVSNSGRVTIVSNGDVDVRATYQQSVMGSLKLVLSQKFVLSGVVTEGPPTNGPLANARVEITAGANAGTFVLTDAAGAFRFNAVTAGAISMQTTKDGYLLWRITNLTMDHDREIDVELFPTPPVNAAGASATARCGDGSSSCALTRGEACTANGGVVYGIWPGPSATGGDAGRLGQREGRVVVDHQEHVRFDADQPSQGAGAEVVQPLRVFPGDQNQEPSNDRCHPPGEQHKK